MLENCFMFKKICENSEAVLRKKTEQTKSGNTGASNKDDSENSVHSESFKDDSRKNSSSIKVEEDTTESTEM